MSNNRPPAPFSPWPYSLIVFFALFILAVVSYAHFAIQNDIELVAPDYYDRELKYGAQMERIARTQALGDAVKLTRDADKQSLVLSLPPTHVAANPTGEITLYHPAKATRDRQFPLELKTDGMQAIPYEWLAGGRWKVQIAWTAGSLDYYLEESVDLRLP